MSLEILEDASRAHTPRPQRASTRARREGIGRLPRLLLLALSAAALAHAFAPPAFCQHPQEIDLTSLPEALTENIQLRQNKWQQTYTFKAPPDNKVWQFVRVDALPAGVTLSLGNNPATAGTWEPFQNSLSLTVKVDGGQARSPVNFSFDLTADPTEIFINGREEPREEAKARAARSPFVADRRIRVELRWADAATSASPTTTSSGAAQAAPLVLFMPIPIPVASEAAEAGRVFQIPLTWWLVLTFAVGMIGTVIAVRLGNKRLPLPGIPEQAGAPNGGAAEGDDSSLKGIYEPTKAAAATATGARTPGARRPGTLKRAAASVFYKLLPPPAAPAKAAAADNESKPEDRGQDDAAGTQKSNGSGRLLKLEELETVLPGLISRGFAEKARVALDEDEIKVLAPAVAEATETKLSAAIVKAVEEGVRRREEIREREGGATGQTGGFNPTAETTRGLDPSAPNRFSEIDEQPRDARGGPDGPESPWQLNEEHYNTLKDTLNSVKSFVERGGADGGRLSQRVGELESKEADLDLRIDAVEKDTPGKLQEVLDAITALKQEVSAAVEELKNKSGDPDLHPLDTLDKKQDEVLVKLDELRGLIEQRVTGDADPYAGKLEAWLELQKEFLREQIADLRQGLSSEQKTHAEAYSSGLAELAARLGDYRSTLELVAGGGQEESWQELRALRASVERQERQQNDVQAKLLGGIVESSLHAPGANGFDALLAGIGGAYERYFEDGVFRPGGLDELRQRIEAVSGLLRAAAETACAGEPSRRPAVSPYVERIHGLSAAFNKFYEQLRTKRLHFAPEFEVPQPGGDADGEKSLKMVGDEWRLAFKRELDKLQDPQAYWERELEQTAMATVIPFVDKCDTDIAPTPGADPKVEESLQALFRQVGLRHILPQPDGDFLTAEQQLVRTVPGELGKSQKVASVIKRGFYYTAQGGEKLIRKARVNVYA